eukprot:2444784-Heterocapsa_arctica.AAC.1
MPLPFRSRPLGPGSGVAHPARGWPAHGRPAYALAARRAAAWASLRLGGVSAPHSLRRRRGGAPLAAASGLRTEWRRAAAWTWASWPTCTTCRSR